MDGIIIGATDSERHRAITTSSTPASRRRQAFPAPERPPAKGLGAVFRLEAAHSVPPEIKYGHVTDGQGKLTQSLQTVPNKFGLTLRFAALPLRFAARNGAQRKLGRSPQYLDNRLRRDRHPSTVPAD